MITGSEAASLLKKNSCGGSRFGCAICLCVSVDESLENMLRQEQYAYMRGLIDLRNYLAAVRWDMSKRDWVGKNVDKHGYLHIAPENWHAGMVEDLLKFCLTLDVQEMEASARLGLETPRFQLVPAEVLVLIDSLWSYFGQSRPFHALSIYREVYREGKRYPIPQVSPSPRVKMGARRYLYIGDIMADEYMFFGLRDVTEEAMCRSCYDPEPYVVKGGKQYLNVPTDDSLTVNPDGLYFLFEHDMDRLIAEMHDSPHYARTAGMMYYLSTGLISIGKGQHSRADAILRRSRLREAKGLIWPYPGIDFERDTISVAEYVQATGELPPDLDRGSLQLF